MSTYLQRNHIKFAYQLHNFASKIEGYAALFGLTEDEIISIKNDAAFCFWVINNYKKVATQKNNWTQFKTLLINGKEIQKDNQPPEQIVLDTMPTPVKAGASLRFTTLVSRIKTHPNYTEGIGQNLGIIYTPSYPSMDEAKPVVRTLVRLGMVKLYWKKDRFDAVRIERNTGDGFKFLDKSLRSKYEDSFELPTAGASSLWHYRLMYLKGDTLVGQWSDIITVTASG